MLVISMNHPPAFNPFLSAKASGYSRRKLNQNVATDFGNARRRFK